MRYLMNYKKEFAITIGVFASIFLIIVWDIRSMVHNQMTWENLVASLGGIVEVMAWWTNIPTSEANAKATAFMRYEKAELKYGELEADELNDDPDEADEYDDDEEEEEDE